METSKYSTISEKLSSDLFSKELSSPTIHVIIILNRPSLSPLKMRWLLRSEVDTIFKFCQVHAETIHKWFWQQKMCNPYARNFIPPEDHNIKTLSLYFLYLVIFLHITLFIACIVYVKIVDRDTIHRHCSFALSISIDWKLSFIISFSLTLPLSTIMNQHTSTVNHR